MATVVRGNPDAEVQALKDALDAYEAEHPDAEASLYRSNPASIRLRVIDRRFEGMSKSRRHAYVWDFLAGRVGEDTLADVSQLLTLAPAELKGSFANFEFEDPMPSSPGSSNSEGKASLNTASESFQLSWRQVQLADCSDERWLDYGQLIRVRCTHALKRHTGTARFWPADGRGLLRHHHSDNLGLSNGVAIDKDGRRFPAGRLIVDLERSTFVLTLQPPAAGR